MKQQLYGVLAGVCFGLAIGIAFAWALHIQEERERSKVESGVMEYIHAGRVK